MGKIIKLPPRADRPVPPPEPVEQATQRLSGTVAELIRTLEASHRRIRVLIDTVPDPAVAARLARDHAILSAALRDAKAKAVSVGLLPSSD